MSKSAIYVANTTAQVLPTGSTINLGNIVRRFGNNFNFTNDSINVHGSGYYTVNATFTIIAATAGIADVTLLKDGVAVQGATASASLEVGDTVTVPINAMIREIGCCADNSSNLTFVLSGTAETVSNSSVVVERI